MKLSFFDLTRYLFLLTVMILVVFGTGSLLRIYANPSRTALYVFYAFVMFADAAAMLFCGLQLNKRTKLIFFLSIVVLALNIFPTIFDQFGFVDFLFALLNIATLVSLILARKEFLSA